MSTGSASSKKEFGGFMKFIKGVERVGNKMPHPVYLFVGLSLIIAVFSLVLAGSAVTYSAPNAAGEIQEKTVAVVNMLSKDGIAKVLSNMVTNYKNLATLTLMLTIIMGSAVAEHSGFFAAVIRKSLLTCPREIIVYGLALVGICANICNDAGMVLGATLGAVIYKSIGRNPWIGGITGFASAAAGYTANLIPASVDAAAASITQEVIDAMKLNYSVHVFSNYIFMVVSTFVLAGVIAVVSETFLVRFLGDTKKSADSADLEKSKLTSDENKGLVYAIIAFIISIGLLLLCTIPSNGLLRNAQGGLVPNSPLMNAIVPILFLIFTIVGSAYGIGAGTITRPSDIPNLMKKGVVEMSSMIIIFFFVAQMLFLFNTSNLAIFVSIKGEHFLRSIGLTGLPLMLVFILFVAFINLFMYSASAKWLLLAPVFIPMLANLGIHPALTQLAYRIGDSCTNSITPLNACLLIAVTVLNNYRDPEVNPEPAGVGTIISTVSVFCFAMLVAFVVLFCIFWIFKLPIGIATPIYG